MNYQQASLQDVRATYKAVQHDVFQKFNIELHPEPVLFDTQRSHLLSIKMNANHRT